MFWLLIAHWREHHTKLQKPLNVITLAHSTGDNIKRMITNYQWLL